MKKLFFAFITFFFFAVPVYAADPIPPELAGNCNEGSVVQKIEVGQSCSKLGSSYTSRTVCSRVGPGNNIPIYTYVCCDTQEHCDQTGPIFIPKTDLASLCNTAVNSLKCSQCMTNGGVWTAVGCIKTDSRSFMGSLLTLAVGIAGGIAFLLILLGGFQILTSAGNPEQLNAGKELVGSAVTGLLLIIFSVFFLKIIGVDILGIPGWGSTTQIPGPR